VLNDHFQDRSGKVNGNAIGYFLRKNQRRVEIGARFEIAGGNTKGNLWRVAIVDQRRFVPFFDDAKNYSLPETSLPSLPSLPIYDRHQGRDGRDSRDVTPRSENFAGESWESGESVPPSSENFAASKNDVAALVHGLKNGYKGQDRDALKAALGWDETRWIAAKNAAVGQGLIYVKAGFWYAEEKAP